MAPIKSEAHSVAEGVYPPPNEPRYSASTSGAVVSGTLECRVHVVRNGRIQKDDPSVHPSLFIL